MTGVQTLYYRFIACSAPPAPTGGDCCPVCGGALLDPVDYQLSEKFTNHDRLHRIPVTEVCRACHWFLVQDNAELGQWVGKPTPQSARAYGFVAKSDALFIGSKARKRAWAKLLYEPPFPVVALIPDSCKKHLFFDTRINPDGADGGWVTFETETFFVEQRAFREAFDAVSALYNAGFNKASILSGEYVFLPSTDMAVFDAHEPVVARLRGSNLLNLAVYLVQKQEEEVNDD